jgi:cytochrome c oxidase subunit 2
MTTRIHMYERAFLVVSALMLVVFLAALGYSAIHLGIHLPTRAGEIRPEEVSHMPPFDTPGVRRVGPDRYEAVVVARAWGFTPTEIRVPAGARVTFRVASLDVIHGFHVEGTRINLMVLPGQISELSYTFDQPGEHLMICHEYCGVGHHGMAGKVIAE